MKVRTSKYRYEHTWSLGVGFVGSTGVVTLSLDIGPWSFTIHFYR